MSSKPKKNQRLCPALGGAVISPAECGSSRGSTHTCPVECPHFPFTPANYDQHDKIEEKLVSKVIARAKPLLSEEDRRHPDLHARIAWELFWRKNEQGVTEAQRWLVERLNGLSNDERVLLQAMGNVRPMLLEIDRIIDGQTIEGVDLLDGQRLRIVDRGGAAAAARYAIVLGWYFPMPHYTRVSGNARQIQDVPNVEAVEVLREVIRHLGGPAGTDQERAWLAEHFDQVWTAFDAVDAARRADLFRATDARVGRTEYTLKDQKGLLALLTAEPTVQASDLTSSERDLGFLHAFDWMDRASPEPNLAQVLLGRVLIGQDTMRLDCFSERNQSKLMEALEARAGDRIAFRAQRVDDLAAQLMETQDLPPVRNAELIPPRLLENPSKFIIDTHRAAPGVVTSQLEFVQELYRSFPDEPAPALDGQTPRAAAAAAPADPALRAKLVRLMKTHIRGGDEQRRRMGLDLNLNPLLEELGLHELISEPPPLGVSMSAPAGFHHGLGDEFFEEESDFGNPSLPPLTEEEALQGLNQILERYPDFDELIELAEAKFPGVGDEVFECLNHLTEVSNGASSILEVTLAATCLLLRPIQPQDPPVHLNLKRLVKRLPNELRRIMAIAEAKSNKAQEIALQKWVEDGPQPQVIMALCNLHVILEEDLPKRDLPTSQELLLLTAMEKCLVAELSR